MANITASTVELFDNGDWAGFASVATDGTWDFPLNNLLEGLHIMTASSGGIQSGEWSVNVQSRSGIEDWTSLIRLEMKANSIYISQTGLIIVVGPFPGYYKIKVENNEQGTELVTYRNGANADRYLAFIFPVTATTVTFNLPRPPSLLPNNKTINFYTESGATIARELTEEPGEQTFTFDEPIRYVHWYRPSYTASDESIKTISWSSGA